MEVFGITETIYIPIKFKGNVIGKYNLENLFSGWGNYLRLPYKDDEVVDSGLLGIAEKIKEMIKCLGFNVGIEWGDEIETFYIVDLRKHKDAPELSENDILMVIKGKKCFKKEDYDEDEDWDGSIEEEDNAIVEVYDEDEEEDEDYEEDEESIDYDEEEYYGTFNLASLPKEVKKFLELLSQEGLEIDKNLLVLLLQRAIGLVIYKNAKIKQLETIAKYITENNFDIVEEIKLNKEIIPVLNEALTAKQNTKGKKRGKNRRTK